jgi:hypothetical protein
MKVFIFSFLIFLSTSFAQAHDHSETICSENFSDVCLHLGIHQKLNTTDAGSFLVHFLVDETQSTNIQNLTVALWMDMGGGHGHGSAPVKVTPKGPGKYLVTDAYFVMGGNWLVKVGFDYQGSHQEIAVPLVIE